MPDLKLAPLHIVFCESGSIYADRNCNMAVFSNEFHADELLDSLKERGGDWCHCKKHTKVTYVSIPETYDWYICPMCPEKKSIPIRAKDVNVLCNCGMMMFGVPKSDPRVRT